MVVWKAAPQSQTRALTVYSLGMVFGMTTWFSTSSVLPQLVRDWNITSTESALLTIMVQLGFVVGGTASTLLFLSDYIRSFRLMAVGCVAAAVTNSALLIQDADFSHALRCRFVTGMCLALVYPSGVKGITSWYQEGRGFAMGVLVGALTLGCAVPHLFNAFAPISWQMAIALSSLTSVVGGVLLWRHGEEGPHLVEAKSFSLRQLPLVVQNKEALVAMAIYFCHNWEIYGFWSWYGQFFSHVLGHNHNDDDAAANSSSMSSRMSGRDQYPTHAGGGGGGGGRGRASDVFFTRRVFASASASAFASGDGSRNRNRDRDRDEDDEDGADGDTLPILLAPHTILAVNRHEKEKHASVSIHLPVSSSSSSSSSKSSSSSSSSSSSKSTFAKSSTSAVAKSKAQMSRQLEKSPSLYRIYRCVYDVIMKEHIHTNHHRSQSPSPSPSKRSSVPSFSIVKGLLVRGVADAWKRLLEPALSREVRRQLTAYAHDCALGVFGLNLRSLLLQPPLRHRTVLGLDPGLRHGCKLALCNEHGVFVPFVAASLSSSLSSTSKLSSRSIDNWNVVYLSKPDEAKRMLTAIINYHNVQVVAIGNGTGCREAVNLVVDVLASLESTKSPFRASPRYAVVDESGASIFSVSSAASTREFSIRDERDQPVKPASGSKCKHESEDVDCVFVSPEIRSSLSLARRLQDPLSELVKLEPHTIGVGLYQHDVNKKQLMKTVDDTVEACVSIVGCDVNTASIALLSRIAGVGPALAGKIVQHRNRHGAFRNRDALHAVKGLGPKAFEQCAGFLRIYSSDEEDSAGVGSDGNRGGSRCWFDETSVHPESYAIAEQLLSRCGFILQPNTKQPVSYRCPFSTSTSALFCIRNKEDFRRKLRECLDRIVADYVSSASSRSETELSSLPLRTRAWFMFFSSKGPSPSTDVQKIGAFGVATVLRLLLQTGKDIRRKREGAQLHDKVMQITDIKAGMSIQGVIRNVVPFGIFVDIGIHSDALLHVSQIPALLVSQSKLLSFGGVSSTSSPASPASSSKALQKVLRSMRTAKTEGDDKDCEDEDEEGDEDVINDFYIGQVLLCRVVSADPATQRVSLSLKCDSEDGKSLSEHNNKSRETKGIRKRSRDVAVDQSARKKSRTSESSERASFREKDKRQHQDGDWKLGDETFARLFVTGFPPNTSEDDLHEMCSKRITRLRNGAIYSVHVPVYPDTKRPRSFAFISVPRSECKEIIALLNGFAVSLASKRSSSHSQAKSLSSMYEEIAGTASSSVRQGNGDYVLRVSLAKPDRRTKSFQRKQEWRKRVN